MRIKTALGDFVRTTLAAVPGYWQKLLYLAELRRGSAEYDHWGMKRRYGTTASASAIGTAHTEVFLSILRTPIPTLLRDLRQSAEQQERSQAQYLEALRAERENLLPVDDGGGSVPHFDLTVGTLESLIQAEAAKDHPDESPPPPPGR